MNVSRLKQKSNGFTFILVLIIASALVLLTTLTLLISHSSKRSAKSFLDSHKLDLVFESAQQEAIAILSNATHREHFVTHFQPDLNGSPRYYLISWFDEIEKQWNHQPLYSGAHIVKNDPTQSDYFHFQISEKHDEIDPMKMENLGCYFRKDGKIAFDASRIVLPSPDQGEYSYSYWIEDLNGLLDYEALTYRGKTSAHSLEGDISIDSESRVLSEEEMQGRFDLKILDQRHLGLNVLSQGEDSFTEFPVDFQAPLSERSSQGFSMQHPFKKIVDEEVPPYALSAESLITEVDSEYRDLKKYITVGLPNSFEMETVPYGYDYKNAGEEKFNLNELIARTEKAKTQEEVDSVVTELSNQIKNVRGFKDNDTEYGEVGISGRNRSHTRYGGLDQAESYCKTLAASIIDYADKNSEPISSPRIISRDQYEHIPPHSYYRGIDAMPLLTDMARRYDLIGGDTEGAFIQIRTFIEIWNPSNQRIKGYIKYEFSPDTTHALKANNEFYPLPAETLYYWNGLITLSPNEYKTIEVTIDKNGDFIGEDGESGYQTYEIPLTGGVTKVKRARGRNNKCALYWYDAMVNHSLGEEDFQLTDGFFSPFSITHGTIGDTKKFPARDKSYTTISHPMMYQDMVGDPRASIYARPRLGLSDDHRVLSFEKSATFGGPNHYLIGQVNSRQTNFESKFPDGNYNAGFLAELPPLRGNITTRNGNSNYLPGEYGYIEDTRDQPLNTKNPDVPYPEPKSDHKDRYLQKISNRGSYYSLGELGNIFDPAQWKKLKRQTSHQNDLLPNDGNDSTDFKRKKSGRYEDFRGDLVAEELDDYGGGITLAIGSPEFNAFDPYADPSYDPTKKGGRFCYEAARLLDQFRITHSPLRSLKSRININTAPPKILQAIFAGFTHEHDRIIHQGISFTQQPKSLGSKDVASALVDGITQQRAKGPYVSLSDIALTRGEYDLYGKKTHLYVFGEAGLYKKRKIFDSHLWSDVGREELFTKVNDLFTTKSRSYRIHLKVQYRREKASHSREKKIDVTLIPYRDDTHHIITEKSPRVVMQYK